MAFRLLADLGENQDGPGPTVDKSPSNSPHLVFAGSVFNLRTSPLPSFVRSSQNPRSAIVSGNPYTAANIAAMLENQSSSY